MTNRLLVSLFFFLTVSVASAKEVSSDLDQLLQSADVRGPASHQVVADEDTDDVDSSSDVAVVVEQDLSAYDSILSR